MRRSVWIAIAGVLVVLFVYTVATAIPNRSLAIGAIGLVFVAVLGLVLNAVDSTEEQSGSTWDMIPRRQYEGRHVETGGATRAEQERAIQEIQDEAEERDPPQR